MTFLSTSIGKMGRSVFATVLLAGFTTTSFVANSVVLVPAAKAQKKTISKKKKVRKTVRKTARKSLRRKLKKTRVNRSLNSAQEKYKAQLNLNTVTLMAGCCTTGSYTAFGADIKDMVRMAQDKSGLRVLPILGGGAGGNVRDILYLRGVDMAIMNTDVIDFFKSKPRYENLTKRIHYITKLFNEEVHLFAGETVSSLHDLEGKTVGFNNSNAAVTGTILFDKLGISPKETLRISEGDGALALKEGRIDAMMRVTGKPIRNISRLKQIYPKIRLLPIAFDPAFIGSHLPTQLSHADYPGLIKKGQIVPTIATRTILAVFNWKPKSERYRRLQKFTNVFFNNFDEARQSRNLHPKWGEVNLQAAVPGMTRFAPAQNWLNARNTFVKRQSGGGNAPKADLMKNFKQFLASRAGGGANPSGTGDTEKLFGDFLAWQQQQR